MKLCRKTENLNQFSIECVRASTLPTVEMWCDGKCFYIFPFHQKNSTPHSDLPIFIPCRSFTSTYSVVYFYSVREPFLPKPCNHCKKKRRESANGTGQKEEKAIEKKPRSNILFFEIVPVVHNVVGWWWMRNDSRFPSFFGFGYLFASTLLSPSSSSVFMYATKISRKILDLVEYYTHDRMFACLLAWLLVSFRSLYFCLPWCICMCTKTLYTLFLDAVYHHCINFPRE